MDILARKCQRTVGEVKEKLFSGHISEFEKQQLRLALKLLSETKKQLRLSKYQTSWLTSTLLLLRAVGFSIDAKYQNSCL
ncbi:hypothetical protein RDI58_027090 [Solanum bulbocastanum]|uniref:Uncharacterized protein n=1 Tax=Solanum bulbocastanum TaxID=147425 RepID=A0AAN8SY45_SOLBU